MSSLIMASLFSSSRSKKRRVRSREKMAEINSSIAIFTKLKEKGLISEPEFELLKNKYLNRYQTYLDRSRFGI